MVDHLAKHTLCHVIVGPIRDCDHRHARTHGPDQTEYFRYFDLSSGLGMAASDKHQLRADVAEFLDDLLNGSNEHRPVAVSPKPIDEVDPNVHIRLHNHHGRSNTAVALSAQCLPSLVSRRLAREGSEHMDRT